MFRFFSRLCSLTLLSLASAPHAAPLDSFIEQFRADPAAMSSQPTVVGNFSNDDIGTIIKALNLSHFTFLAPIIIRANEFHTQSLTVNSISLMAVRGQQLIPIPFQIDELDQSGLVHMEGSSKHDSEGKLGIFDESDELLFMFRDASLKQYRQENMRPLQHGTILKEINLSDNRSQSTRYVYLVENNSQRSKGNYVDIDLEKGMLSSTFLTFEFDPENFLDIKNARPKIGDKKNKNIFDSIFFELSAGIFNKNLRVKFTSGNNVSAKAIAVKDGPIRATTLIEVVVKFGLVTVMKDQFNLSSFEQAFNMRTRFSGDSYSGARYISFIIRDPKMLFTMDFVGLEGAQVGFQSTYDANNPAWIDGKMSNVEINMSNARLPGNWIWLSSGSGWDMFLNNQLSIETGGFFNAFLEGVELNVIYEDSSKPSSQPERFPGAGPRIGLRGEGLPIIAIKLMSALKDVPFEDIASFNEMQHALIKLDDEGKLRKVDKIIRQVFVKMKRDGKYTTKEQLAQAYIADANRIGLVGISRRELNELTTYAFTQMKSFEEFSLGKALRDFQQRAKK